MTVLVSKSTWTHNRSYYTLQALVCCTLALRKADAHLKISPPCFQEPTRGAARDERIVPLMIDSVLRAKQPKGSVT